MKKIHTPPSLKHYINNFSFHIKTPSNSAPRFACAPIAHRKPNIPKEKLQEENTELTEQQQQYYNNHARKVEIILGNAIAHYTAFMILMNYNLIGYYTTIYSIWFLIGSYPTTTWAILKILKIKG